ncbi:MAG TPA: carbon starvation protein A [Verrucomicrobia bacterium]|nr:carbon starvation protein A [Verrucomicrobiota bacterium]
MGWFIGGLLFLVLGYFAYGRVIERILGPDGRSTPATELADGVDYVPLPKWKNMLIQLLNIAGVGPVIGVIAGIKFGKVALLIIPVGCVFIGAVHDFASGFVSLRMKGANLPAIVSAMLGKAYAAVFSVALIFLLILMVAVFVNIPASLIDRTVFPAVPLFTAMAVAIFAYYIIATLFPVDKIIGAIYPYFGGLLVVGSLAMCVALLVAGFQSPELLQESPAFLKYRAEVFDAGGRSPLFPLLFVTIACGIVSGFHATQSPIVARTMRSEREARTTYYGMMIAEGVIAMIWAAAALAMYNKDPATLYLAPADVLGRVTTWLLGPWMGGVTVFAIVVLAVTSGDTGLRSARMSLAEILGIPQKKILPRILVCLPLVVLVALCLHWSNESADTFAHIWNYFAWGNQVMSATTLMACTVWLLRKGRKCAALVTLIPGMFMTSVVTTFILWTSADKGQPHGIVPGGLPLSVSIGLSVLVALVFAFYVVRRARMSGATA